MSDENIVDPNAQSELSIKDEYQLWRKNCRYMYEFVSETALTWPSLTVQWMPNYNESNGVTDCELLLGTHTSGEDTNYLKLAGTQLPSSKKSEDGKKVSSRIKITKKLQNNYEVNRARYMPQEPLIIATINGHGEVDLFNLTNDSKQGYAHFTPHDENGYGLSWNAFKRGYLLTASDDKTVALTDVNENPQEMFKIEAHSNIVNDVQWHRSAPNLFGSVSDDQYFYLYDIRDTKRPVMNYFNEGSKGINSLAFSPFSENLAAIGNTNSNIDLLDLRFVSSDNKKTTGHLHTMMGHSGLITSLEFSPLRDGILASGSEDRRLIIWDTSKIGEEQLQEDAEDGCPELFMMHAGHTGAVMDFNWCPFKDWTIASVADDNIVHLWQVGEKIITSDVISEVDPGYLE